MNATAAARFDLSGRIAWMVGGAGYLGAPISRALAEHGAHVVISGRSAEHIAASAAALRSEGLSAEALALDVTRQESVDAAVDRIM